MKERFWNIVNALRETEIIDSFCLRLETMKHHTKMKWFNNVTFLDYCERMGDDYSEIEPRQKRLICVPEYFEKSKEKIVFEESPAVFKVKLKDVCVVGGSAAVLSKDCVIYDEWKTDTENRILYRNAFIKKNKKEKSLIEYKDSSVNIPKAINMCGVFTHNYYHFSVEVLSRYYYVKDTDIKIPVLIDTAVVKYSQMKDLLSRVIGERPVVYVEPGQKIHIGEMIMVSPVTWKPANIKKNRPCRLSDNLITESAIKTLKTYVPEFLEKKTNRKIFISRKNIKIQRISNEKKITELFEEAGFEVVYPEEMTYEEQVRCFSSASCIVGASGAAMTNLVYASEGTVYGCMISDKYKFCIFSTIAKIMGCKVLFLDAPIVVDKKNEAEDICEVDEEKCKGFIQKLLGLCEIKD